MYYVYALRNIKNNKSYIGTSSQISIRFNRHYNDLVNNKHFNRLLQRDYNEGNLLIENIILFEFENIDDSYYYESMYIKLYNTNNKDYGYNLTEGGKCMNGYTFTDSDVKKLKNRNYRIGKDNHMNGYKHSEITKNKLSNSMGGKNNPMYGKSRSDKVKDLISKSMKNKNQDHLIPIFEDIIKLRKERHTYDYIVRELNTSRYMISKAIKYDNLK